ncbi:MAG: enoyl-CoA hydratase/isomerase family protein, partial [Burkholderiales bacterium]
MKSSIDKLIAKKDGHIGWITFNQPEKLNAVSFEMWEALPLILKEMEEDIDIRLVILKGAGEKAFVSGADISQFGEKRSSTEAVLAY